MVQFVLFCTNEWYISSDDVNPHEGWLEQTAALGTIFKNFISEDSLILS